MFNMLTNPPLYLLLALFIIAIVSHGLEQAYKFLENNASVPEKRSHYNKVWHRMQFSQQLVLGSLVFFLTDVYTMFLFSTTFWLVFDWLVHIVGLRQGWWFMGTTGAIDSWFQKTFKNPSRWYYSLKIILWATSLILFIVKLNSQ